jgi:flagellar biosynthesis protein FliQ
MHNLTYITQQALYLVIVVSAPSILASLIIGFIIAVFQATTHIQEQTLTFAPKVILVFAVLAITGSWAGSQMMRFTFHIFDRFPELIGR